MRTTSSSSLVRQLGTWRSRAASRPAYRQLADAIRLLVLDGRLPLNVRLPGERDLAAALAVSRTTVTNAYAVLQDERFLAIRRGSGSRTTLPEGPGSRGTAMAPSGPDGSVIDFASAVLPANEFVHAAYAKALAALPLHLPDHGYEPEAVPELRSVLAERYTRSGLATTPDQILVTHGALNAFALVLRLFGRPGDRVAIDHPTYPHAIDAIQRALCRPVPIPLLPGGWDVNALASVAGRGSVRLAYIVADHHNPTGHVMPVAIRQRLIAEAAHGGTVVVFDETLVDLWLDAPPPPPSSELDGPHVIRLGSMGKSFWGGFRLGWLRTDASVVSALSQVRVSLDLGTPILEQLAATVMLSDANLVLEARRSLLRGRRHHLLQLVRDRLPDWRFEIPCGGLSLWAELPEPVSTAVAAASERHGLRVAAGPRFGVDGAFERYMRLPFTLEEDQLSEAVRRLAVTFETFQPSTTSVRGSTSTRSPASVF